MNKSCRKKFSVTMQSDMSTENYYFLAVHCYIRVDFYVREKMLLIQIEENL